MKRLCAVLLLLAFALPVGALPVKTVAEPGLAVEGETLILVTKLPFKVTAPAGAKLYFWRLPGNWKADAPIGSNSAEVTEAPEGKAVVAVDAIAADFSAKTYRLEVTVGRAIPPPPAPPGPGPAPPLPDQFTAALKAAYAVEPDPQKLALVKSLALVYRTAATLTDTAEMKTWGQLYAALRAGATQQGVTGKLALVQRAVGAELSRLLPVDPLKTPEVAVTQSHRDAIKAAFLRVAQNLEMLP